MKDVQKKKNPLKEFFFKIELKFFPEISFKIEFGFKR